ncbi:MAG: hypothetical protein ACRYG2_26800 [Janthinobacterium lividum]
MNHLMPPPQRKLPEDVRRDIRGTLVRTSQARTSTRRPGRVVIPALALTGALGAAAVVGLNLPGHLGQRGVGVPAPAGPVPTATPGQTPATSAIPAAQTIDSGPLSNSTADKIVKDCLHGSPGGGNTARVHIARQTSVAGPVVVLTDTVGILHLCRGDLDIVGPPLDAGGPLGDIQRPSPTQDQPVVQLTGYAGSGSHPAQGHSDTAKNTDTSYYRVSPDVASLQVRLTVDGHTGPWTQAIIGDGYAWVCASADYPVSKDDPAPDITEESHVEDRAFDAAGHELDINRVHR